MEKKVILTTNEKKYVKKLEKGFNINDSDKKRAVASNDTIDVSNNIEELE